MQLRLCDRHAWSQPLEQIAYRHIDAERIERIGRRHARAAQRRRLRLCTRRPIDDHRFHERRDPRRDLIVRRQRHTAPLRIRDDRTIGKLTFEIAFSRRRQEIRGCETCTRAAFRHHREPRWQPREIRCRARGDVRRIRGLRPQICAAIAPEVLIRPTLPLRTQQIVTIEVIDHERGMQPLPRISAAQRCPPLDSATLRRTDTQLHRRTWDVPLQHDVHHAAHSIRAIHRRR